MVEYSKPRAAHIKPNEQLEATGNKCKSRSHLESTSPISSLRSISRLQIETVHRYTEGPDMTLMRIATAVSDLAMLARVATFLLHVEVVTGIIVRRPPASAGRQ